MSAAENHMFCFTSCKTSSSWVWEPRLRKGEHACKTSVWTKERHWQIVNTCSAVPRWWLFLINLRKEYFNSWWVQSQSHRTGVIDLYFQPLFWVKTLLSSFSSHLERSFLCSHWEVLPKVQRYLQSDWQKLLIELNFWGCSGDMSVRTIIFAISKVLHVKLY